MPGASDFSALYGIPTAYVEAATSGISPPASQPTAFASPYPLSLNVANAVRRFNKKGNTMKQPTFSPDGVFRYRQKDVVEGLPIFTLLRRGLVQGDIGIEIEVEGNKFKKVEGHEGTHTPRQMPGLPVWSYVHDGSLRGKDNAEYVFTKPIEFDGVKAAIDDLWQMFEDYGSILDVSNRTSVHVHLNCQPFHMNRLTSFLALYMAVEEPLTAWCGEHRVGNLFCMRSKDAPGIVTAMKKYIQSEGHYELRDGLHYAGLNLHSIQKHGSVEIRTLRGAIDPATVMTWVGILRRLYELSAEYPDPRTVCEAFSGNGGPLGFFEMVLGDFAETVRNEIPYTDQQLRTAMFEGIRLAQDLCYCRDWDCFKAVKVTTDPFGRVEQKKGFAPIPSPLVFQVAPENPYEDGTDDWYQWEEDHGQPEESDDWEPEFDEVEE